MSAAPHQCGDDPPRPREPPRRRSCRGPADPRSHPYAFGRCVAMFPLGCAGVSPCHVRGSSPAPAPRNQKPRRMRRHVKVEDSPEFAPALRAPRVRCDRQLRPRHRGEPHGLRRPARSALRRRRPRRRRHVRAARSAERLSRRDTARIRRGARPRRRRRRCARRHRHRRGARVLRRGRYLRWRTRVRTDSREG